MVLSSIDAASAEEERRVKDLAVSGDLDALDEFADCEEHFPLGGPMSVPERLRRSPGWWLAMAGIVLGGAAVGAVAFVVTAFGMLGARGAAPWFVFALLTVLPALFLWSTRKPSMRSFALGLVAVFLAAAFVMLAWHPWTTMDEDEIRAAESEVLAAGHPVFYLGHAVDGFELNEYYLSPGDTDFLYGECRGDAEDACVVWDVEVHTDWDDVMLAGDAIAGCSLLEPIAGVPTVRLHNEELGIDDVALFTGDARVTLVFAAKSSLEEKLRVARGIRQVAEPHAADSLPTATPEVLAYVERHCGGG